MNATEPSRVEGEPGSPDANGAPRSGGRTNRQIGLIVAVAVVSLVASQLFGRRYSFFDMKIYHGAVEWWTSGGALYEYASPTSGLGFTYPPFAALSMLPMALTSATVAGWINAIASTVALAVVLAALLPPIADRLGWPRWLALGVAMPLALAIEPTRETLGFGQVNLLLFALVLADLVALRWRANGPPRVATGPLARFWYSGAWAGAGIGLATAVKLTPGLFIVYLLVSRQWRTAVVASGTAAGASVLAWVIAPRESMAYFTSVLWQTDRVGTADFTPNQSLAGILARLYDSTSAPGLLWLTFAAVCCALGLSRAVNAHAEGDELAAFTLVGLTATVISPISWSHHLVFVVPAIVIMVDATLRRRAAGRWLGRTTVSAWTRMAAMRYALGAVAVYLVFLMAPIWWVRHRLPEGSHYDSGLWGVLAENSLALAVIALVAAMPWRMGAEPAFPPARSLARPQPAAVPAPDPLG